MSGVDEVYGPVVVGTRRITAVLGVEKPPQAREGCMRDASDLRVEAGWEKVRGSASKYFGKKIF